MEALKEALKELGRVVLMAVIPFVIVAVENGSIDYKAVGIVAALAALRFIDKYLHEVGKAKEEGSVLTLGLTRF
jgi:hypothetical protein